MASGRARPSKNSKRSAIMLAMTTTTDRTLATFVGDDERWEAVKRRNRDADGAFYYSVLTTGVYCRPTCAARLPRRENVGFHATCAEAERAGFRPCKRCRPNEAALAERQASAVAKACRSIEQADEAPSLDTLAETAGMSRFHFHRVFKARTGVTPTEFRAGGNGSSILFAFGECSLGSVLVAATGKGVCAIQFGDDPDALVRG